MTSRKALWQLPLVAAMAASWSFAACSNDDTGIGTTTESTGGYPVGTGGLVSSGGATGSGGASSGGTSGSGGSVGTGGAGATGGGPADAGPVIPDAGLALYMCEKRPPRDPGGSGAVGAACCGGKGSCATNTSPNAELGHDTCGTSLFCEPTAPTASAFTTCRSRIVTSVPNGLEGRCVPKCFTLGNPQSVVLDDGRASADAGPGPCGADEVCAPCFSPVDGKATGACSLKTGDAPAEAAPTPYKSCPAGNDAGQPQGGGLCLPGGTLTALTNPAHPYYNPAIPGLKQDNCAAGEKCVPTMKVADPGYCAPRCATSNFTVAAGGAKEIYRAGACTPTYVIWDIAGTTGVTVSSGGGPCSADLLCAPCLSPIITPTANMGDPSGACY